jgi:hypothetical protein
MSMRILYDQWGGIIRWVDIPAGGDEVIVHTEQEAGRLLRANARDADVDQSKRTFRLAARVPMPIVQKAIREGWHRDPVKWRNFLNDPDNRAFRVWQGKI